MSPVIVIPLGLLILSVALWLGAGPHLPSPEVESELVRSLRVRLVAAEAERRLYEATFESFVAMTDVAESPKRRASP